MRVRKIRSARELRRSRALLASTVDASFLSEFDDIPELQQHWQCLADDGTLAGVAGAYVTEDDELCLTYCVVAPDHRGGGMQAALITAREKWGKGQGCHKAVTYAARRSFGSVINLTKAQYRIMALDDYFLCFEKDLA